MGRYTREVGAALRVVVVLLVALRTALRADTRSGTRRRHPPPLIVCLLQALRSGLRPHTRSGPRRRHPPPLIACLLALLDAGAPPARAAAAPPDSRENPQWVELETRPGQGEQCLVCRKRIFDEDVVEIRYQGRTFHVGVPFFGDFKDDPQRYFARLQARSALFDENAMRPPPMALGWLGLYDNATSPHRLRHLRDGLSYGHPLVQQGSLDQPAGAGVTRPWELAAS